MLGAGGGKERIDLLGGHLVALGVVLALDRAEPAPEGGGLLRDEIDTDIDAVSQFLAVGPLQPQPDPLETLRAVLVVRLERSAHQPLEPATRVSGPAGFAAQRLERQIEVAVKELARDHRHGDGADGGGGHGRALRADQVTGPCSMREPSAECSFRTKQ